MSRLTKDDIVSGAGRRFATHGYHGTSMRDLGDDLGILGSSIYSHVGGKQELLVAVVERGAEFFDAAAERAIVAGGSPSDVLRRLIEGHVAVVLDHRPEARTYMAEVDFLDPPEQRRVNDMRNGYEEAFRSTIASGIESGDFRKDIDPSLSAIYVLSILNAIDRWYDETGRLGRTQLVDNIQEFVIGALT